MNRNSSGTKRYLATEVGIKVVHLQVKTMKDKHLNDQTSRWDNELIISYMKEKLEDSDACSRGTDPPKPFTMTNEEGYNEVGVSDACSRGTDPPKPFTRTNEEGYNEVSVKPSVLDSNAKETDRHVARAARLRRNSSVQTMTSFLTIDTQDTPEFQKTYSILQPTPDISASKPEYKILRSLPGYNIGDPLRKEDLILCYSKEATSFAMNRIRPGDCVFILRSDGSFTYALYEGHAKRDTSSLSFQVDNGHFKRVSTSKFCKLVKVPVLLGTTATAAKANNRRQRRASTTEIHPVSRLNKSWRSHQGARRRDSHDIL